MTRNSPRDMWPFTLFTNRQPRHETSDAIANAVRLPSADDDGDLPEWIRIVPVGSFPEHPDGAHALTRSDLEQMVANFKQRSDDLLIDYDHDSIFERRTRAAGWATELEVREDGLYMRRPEWTPPAQDAIANREYRYLSPVYFLNTEDGTGALLHSVAITNTPYFNEGQIDPIGNTSAVAEPNEPNTEDLFMDRDELIEKLGLSEDATDEDIEQALEQLKSDAGTEEAEGAEAEEEQEEEGGVAVAEEADEEDEDASEDLADEADLEARVNSLEQQLQNQRQEDAASLVEDAIEDGKIKPSEKEIYLNSAKADFEGTKKRLAQKEKGEALPQGININTNATRTEKKSALAEYIEQQC